MLRVTFIHHSAFVVETEHRTLVFDYFPSEDFPEQEFHGKKPVFAADKPIYVFASHGHRDHFSREVLRWGEKRKDMTYIFSRDIRVSRLSLLKDGMDPALRKPGRHHGAAPGGARRAARRTGNGSAHQVGTDRPAAGALRPQR